MFARGGVIECRSQSPPNASGAGKHRVPAPSQREGDDPGFHRMPTDQQMSLRTLHPGVVRAAKAFELAPVHPRRQTRLGHGAGPVDFW